MDVAALTMIEVNSAWWTAFLLMLCRTGGWLLTTPLFGARGTGSKGRVAAGVALSMVLAGRVPVADLPPDLGGFVFEALIQVAIGAVFGWLTSLLLHAPAIAGALADNMSGLGFSAVMDPASGQQVSVFARLFSMTFLALLLSTSAYATIITGFARSLEAFGVGSRPTLAPDAYLSLAFAMTALLRAAFEVGAPMIGVLLLTDVALGLAARFFPQANITFLALGLKTLLALGAAGAALTLLPGRIDGLIEFGERLVRAVLTAGGGG
jgi:flagellar biosynthesis protein FliR